MSTSRRLRHYAPWVVVEYQARKEKEKSKRPIKIIKAPSFQNAIAAMPNARVYGAYIAIARKHDNENEEDNQTFSPDRD
jgi:hypothetical protein